MKNTSVIRTKNTLILENEALHSRLAEVEETLRSIQSGEVDAIVISGTNGDQVYSLTTAETPYRNFVEEMHEGALTLNKKGLILYCNDRLAQLVNEPADLVMGSFLHRFITPADHEALEKLLFQPTLGNDDVLIVTLVNAVFLKLSFRHMPPNLHGENYIVIATDITDLKKKEKKLLGLQHCLKRQLDQLRDLRIELINSKIDVNAENSNLKNTNKNLVKENTRQKLAIEQLKQKVLLLTMKN